jgi:hypothetical protein
MLAINWKGYRFRAWIGQTLLAISTIAAVGQENCSNAIVFQRSTSKNEKHVDRIFV